MKIQSHFLVFIFFTVLFTCSAFALADSIAPGRPSPKLSGVNTLWINVRVDGNVPNHITLPAKIEKQCSQKLQKTGIFVTSDPALCTWSTKSKIPVLKIRIDVFEINDSPNCIFHAKTAFSRTVSLDMESGPLLYKADVWESKSIMESAVKEKLPEVLTDAVLRQVDAFAAAWSVTNESDPNSVDNKRAKSPDRQQSKPSEKQPSKQKLVASKNSDVFHKPDCPFAQNISPKNIIDYNGPEEAIAAGKRPCKKCNP